MKNLLIFALIAVGILLAAGCLNKAPRMAIAGSLGSSSLQVVIEPGKHWIHKMPILGIFKLKNRPQIAVWMEDADGNFVRNLYVTKKTATQGWMKGPGDPTPKDKIRRYEALPYWMHRQNREFEPGVLMPTKKHPLPQAVTSATPKGSLYLQDSVADTSKAFSVYIEINQSTDFNAFFSAARKTGEPGYNGGKWGSGQPSLVYSAKVTPDSSSQDLAFELIGHGSPDGKDGELYPDLANISTAKSIIGTARVVFTKR